MKYVDLINLGFERFDFNCGYDVLGFNDFYLFLKVSDEISFEWNWNTPDIIKMVRYKKANVKNYIIIKSLDTLKSLLYLYTKDEGNKGNKPIINESSFTHGA